MTRHQFRDAVETVSVFSCVRNSTPYLLSARLKADGWLLPVQGWTPSNKIWEQNSRSLEIRDSDVGNVRMTNVNTEARSDVCILVTSQMVIGLPFNPKGLQFSVVFSAVHIMECCYYSYCLLLHVCMCVTYCLYGCVSSACVRCIGFASPHIFVP
jgi:hypothetical protein